MSYGSLNLGCINNTVFLYCHKFLMVPLIIFFLSELGYTNNGWMRAQNTPRMDSIHCSKLISRAQWMIVSEYHRLYYTVVRLFVVAESLSSDNNLHTIIKQYQLVYLAYFFYYRRFSNKFKLSKLKLIRWFLFIKTFV